MEKYKLPNLPYGYKDLEPHISEEIMRFHHDKHHAAYVNNLNATIEKHPELFEKNPEELLINLDEIPEDIKSAVRNNGGGVVNHSLFWRTMAPNGGGEPRGKIAEAIRKQFGNFNQFKEKFNNKGLEHFGSGWVWLVKNNKNELEIISTPNQDNPISKGKKPLILNDLWEHAYYLQYKNRKADYLEAWWNVINWEEIEKRFNN